MANNKIAILIDGGFFVQMYKKNNSNTEPQKKDVEDLIRKIMADIQEKNPDGQKDTLLRTFYYDCQPFAKKIKNPTGGEIDCSQSKIYTEKTKYINSLRNIEQFAIRLGQLSFSGWRLNSYKPNPNKPKPDFRQKGVDMKIGLDMAWMAGKRTVDKIVLVTGDSDFISPIKLVRREGILVYLHTMKSNSIKRELLEHADFVF